MLQCKQVAEALADHHYDDLPKWKKIGLKLHVALCFVCSRYHKDVMLMQDCARGLSEHNDGDAATSDDDLRMSDEAKNRIKSKLASK